MSNRAWRIGIARRFTLGNARGEQRDQPGAWDAPAWSGAAEAIVRQAIFDGLSASAAITLDSATLSSTVQALALASLDKQLDAATLSSTVQSLALASLSTQLDDAVLAAEVDALGGATLAVQLDDVQFAAAAEVLVQASAVITLDDASLSCLINATGAVLATLAVTLDDATLASTVNVQQVAPPVTLPVHGIGGGQRRRRGRVSPPVYVGTYQDELRRVFAEVAVVTDDATLDARIELGRLAALAIPLEPCILASIVEVDWKDVIEDEDVLLQILAAA